MLLLLLPWQLSLPLLLHLLRLSLLPTLWLPQLLTLLLRLLLLSHLLRPWLHLSSLLVWLRAHSSAATGRCWPPRGSGAAVTVPTSRWRRRATTG